jgi:DNA-binding Lrp family transcriptional regulator
MESSMVKIETSSVEELDYFIFKKLRTIKGVDAVTTLIVACAHMGW